MGFAAYAHAVGAIGDVRDDAGVAGAVAIAVAGRDAARAISQLDVHVMTRIAQ